MSDKINAEEMYWVIKDKLLGVRKPTSLEEVSQLKELGITGIISLLDDKENHELYKSTPIEFLWIPVKGGTAPIKQQSIDAQVFYKKHIALVANVVVRGTPP